MKVRYIVSLDYDFWPLSAVRQEAFRLENQFKIKLDIWKSSSSSYHLCARRPISWNKAKKILAASNCSKKYKGLCLRLKWFPTRQGEKLVFNKDNNIHVIIPALKLLTAHR